MAKKTEDPHSVLDYLGVWTDKENESYQQVQAPVLTNYYRNHGIPNWPASRVNALVTYFLNEELGKCKLHHKLMRCGFSLRDILEKFASEKRHEGLNMLETLAVKKLKRSLPRRHVSKKKDD